MRMKSFLIALALMAPMAPGGPARAADEVHCTNVHELTISPGISLRGTSGTFHDITGTMTCPGPINGRTPTGAGSYHDSGRYGTRDPDTCQDGGEGDGVFSSTIPTTEGDLVLTAPYTWSFGDLTSNPGYVSGAFRGDGAYGTFKVTPIEGDCLTGITKVRVDAEFWFAQSFFNR